jgi:hypothetical protein
MYAPIIKSARRVREHELGPSHSAVLLTDIKGDTRILYSHLLVIFKSGREHPVAFVSSEATGGKNAGVHYLCTFTEEGHANFGASDDWADLEKFERGALELVHQLKLIEQT